MNTKVRILFNKIFKKKKFSANFLNYLLFIKKIWFTVHYEIMSLNSNTNYNIDMKIVKSLLFNSKLIEV
jgi:hypothetical protein